MINSIHFSGLAGAGGCWVTNLFNPNYNDVSHALDLPVLEGLEREGRRVKGQQNSIIKYIKQNICGVGLDLLANISYVV